MEATISQVKTGHQFTAVSIFKHRNGVDFCLPVQKDFQKERVLRVIKCGGKGVSSVEKISMENEKFDMGMKKLINSEKCKELGDVGGIVDLLECLEREAIMGEDEGREPNDYNTRAQIFDKSSKVFQALKQSTSAV